MKYIPVLILLFACRLSSPKPPLSFNDVLKNSKEIVFHDSLLLDFASLPKKPLDTVTGKQHWKFISPYRKKMIQNADYFIAGKITSNPKIDLLLLGIERSSGDHERKFGISQELFVIILDKNGNYIGSRDASTYWDIKENNKIAIAEKLTSWLSKDLRLMRCSELRIKDDSIYFINSYNFSHTGGIRLNEYGTSPVQVRELTLDTLSH